jgi:hypothetical protein
MQIMRTRIFILALTYALALPLPTARAADAPGSALEAGLEASAREPFKLNLGAIEEDPSADLATDHWRVELTMWIWLMGLEGDVGAHGLTKSVDASFLDILDATDSIVGLSGRVEFGKGRWGGFVDGLYNKLGVEDITVNASDVDVNADIDFDIDLGGGPFNPNPNPNPDPSLDLGLLPTEIDITMQLAVVDLGVMYRIGAWPIGESAAAAGRELSLDAYAGARVTHLSVELDPAGPASAERDDTWVDPIIGLKARFPLSKRWEVLTWGDIGGFGVSSDFTWSAGGVLGYNFTMFGLPSTVYGGYRAMGWDYSRGGGRGEFVWDATLHGPLLGLSVSF